MKSSMIEVLSFMIFAVWCVLHHNSIMSECMYRDTLYLEKRDVDTIMLLSKCNDSFVEKYDLAILSFLFTYHWNTARTKGANYLQCYSGYVCLQ